MTVTNYTVADESAQFSVKLTKFPDVHAKTLQVAERPWNELVDLLTSPAIYTAKEHQPLLSLCQFSGEALPSGCLRSGHFVTECHGIEIDYDDGVITIEQARDILQDAGIISVIHTTASCHQPKGNKPPGWRWRAVIPFSAPVPALDRARYVGMINALFGGAIGAESFDLGRSFYVGRLRGVHWETAVTTGMTLDAMDVMQEMPVLMPSSFSGGATQEVKDPTLKSDAVGAFCRAYSAREAIAEFLPDVFEPLNDRRYSWIGHAPGGVWIHEGGHHIGANHASWQFGVNRLANTFDVVRVMLFGDQDEGLPEETAPYKMPSYRSMLKWMGTLAPVRAQGFSYSESSSATSAADFEAIDQAVEALEQKGDQGFELKSMDEMALAPPVPWLIKHLIPAKSVGVTYGAPGSGKSFLALDMALTIAGAQTSFGSASDPRRVNHTPVLFVCAEGAGGFGQRLEAYREYHQMATGLDKQDFAVLPNTVDLGSPEMVARIERTIEAQFDGREVFVVLDTLAATTPGLDENSKEILVAFSVAQRLIDRFGCTVMMIHHAGKDSTKGSRGFSGIKGACDFEIEVLRIEDDEGEAPTEWCYRVSKQKDAEDGRLFGFRLEPVELRRRDVDGDKRTSLVVEHLDQAPQLTSGKKKGKGTRPLSPLHSAIVNTIEDADGWIDQKDVVDRVIEDYPDVVKKANDPREAVKAGIRKVRKKTDLGGEILMEKDGRYPKYRFDPDLENDDFED